MTYASRNQERSLRSALFLYPSFLRCFWLVGDSFGFRGIRGFGQRSFSMIWATYSAENMDGPEGEEHVHLGANIMGLLFGDWWADFTLRHSRYWAKRNGVSFQSSATPTNSRSR